MAARLAIASVTDSPSFCIPNLMPFHIGYSGLAPISTYMRVEPSHQTIGAPAMDTEHGHNAIDSALTNNDEDISVDTTQPIEIGASQSSQEDATNSSPSASRRHVSTFRGRTIHGLDVDLPEGYAGLILRAEGYRTTNSSSSRDRRQEERTTVKRVTRRSKQIAVRDGTGEVEVEVEASEKVARNVEIMDLTDSVEEDIDEYLPTRILIPTAQFRSLRFWNADRPADDGADEYARSLSEWIALAHHIHQIPP